MPVAETAAPAAEAAIATSSRRAGLLAANIFQNLRCFKDLTSAYGAISERLREALSMPKKADKIAAGAPILRLNLIPRELPS